MSDRICSFPDCGKPLKTRGLCQPHYKQLWRGEALRPLAPPRGSVSLQDRLWQKVEKTETCWLWTGSGNGHGYGQIGQGDRKFYVHRLAYEWLVGPIAEGMQVDHLCMVRRCVNPDHMEIVTPKVNANRGYGQCVTAALQLAKTHCKHGHEYTPENTRIDKKRGIRLCRTCEADTRRRWREKHIGTQPKAVVFTTKEQR